MKLPKNQAQILLTSSNPTASPLPLNVETLKILLVYGGISVATILAMSIFVKIFMEKLTKMLRNSSEQQYKPKKRNNTILKK